MTRTNLRRAVAVVLFLAGVILAVVAIILVGSSTNQDTVLRLGFAGAACAATGGLVLTAAI